MSGRIYYILLIVHDFYTLRHTQILWYNPIKKIQFCSWDHRSTKTKRNIAYSIVNTGTRQSNSIAYSAVKARQVQRKHATNFRASFSQYPSCEQIIVILHFRFIFSQEIHLRSVVLPVLGHPACVYRTQCTYNV